MAYPRLSNVQILKLSPTHPYLGLRPIESNWRLRAHRIRATWQAGDNQMYRSSALVQILGTYLLGAGQRLRVMSLLAQILCTDDNVVSLAYISSHPLTNYTLVRVSPPFTSLLVTLVAAQSSLEH